MLVSSIVKQNFRVRNYICQLIAEVVIAPSALHISTVKSNIRPDVGIAIQDVHTSKVSPDTASRHLLESIYPRTKLTLNLMAFQSLGAYTGSHVIEQVKDFGLNWVLVGHSERRTIWNETDEQSAEKAHMTIDAGMNAIFCIGETLPEREDNKTMEILFRQMKVSCLLWCNSQHYPQLKCWLFYPNIRQFSYCLLRSSHLLFTYSGFDIDSSHRRI